MGLVEEVLHKGFNNCSNDEIEAAYVETFGFPPCQSCAGTKKYRDAYNAIYKSVNKLLKVKSMKPTTEQKYYWNPEHKNKTVHIKKAGGRAAAYTGNCTDQEVLEKIFNQPNRSGIVLLNSDFKENETTVSPDAAAVNLEIDKEKLLCLTLASEGKSVNAISKEMGITYHKVKKYLNE